MRQVISLLNLQTELSSKLLFKVSCEVNADVLRPAPSVGSCIPNSVLPVVAIVAALGSFSCGTSHQVRTRQLSWLW